MRMAPASSPPSMRAERSNEGIRVRDWDPSWSHNPRSSGTWPPDHGRSPPQRQYTAHTPSVETSWKEPGGRISSGEGMDLKEADDLGWHHSNRIRGPGLRWPRDYTPEDLKCGRVLMIDYVKKDHTKEGMRKVAAEEFENIETLRKVYTNPDRDREAVLRVFHVQNADWATRFLMRKFNIDNRDNLVGTDFGNWVRHKRADRRSKKPVFNGKTWRTQHDPWRGISRTMFGVDYLKHYKRDSSGANPNSENSSAKMMELNCPNSDEMEDATDGYNVHIQRLSVYIQHKEGSPSLPTDPDISNPYREADYLHSKGIDHRGTYIPVLNSLDNGNAIIVFEDSHSGSIEDTLISARREWESRWRRLPFYLAYESHDPTNEAQMALECMNIILQDIMKAICEAWESFLDAGYYHVSMLEDKIYEQPADESRAPELWTNSSQWLKVEKLMMIHIDILKELRTHLTDLSDDGELESNWLENSPADFERLSNLIQEDLIKPTANLADLMYKSVGIRDSRHSLRLGTSMWRLSWITFIFLPLTFMVGFFGMNVDTFKDDPSIKWYFIVAIPFMLMILIFWYITKHLLARRRQTPYQRGIYEHFFNDMANRYPSLWSRRGPRAFVVPKGLFNWIKWRFVRSWASPGKTIRMGYNDGEEDSDDGLSSWSRMKRYLIRKWTAEIDVSGLSDSSTANDNLMEQGLVSDAEDSDGHTAMVANGVGAATELLALPGAGADAVQENGQTALPGGFLRVPRINPFTLSKERRARPVSNGSSGSNTTSRNSRIMVEEKEPDWLVVDKKNDNDQAPSQAQAQPEVDPAIVAAQPDPQDRSRTPPQEQKAEHQKRRGSPRLSLGLWSPTAAIRRSMEQRSHELMIARSSGDESRSSSKHSKRRKKARRSHGRRVGASSVPMDADATPTSSDQDYAGDAGASGSGDNDNDADGDGYEAGASDGDVGPGADPPPQPLSQPQPSPDFRIVPLIEHPDPRRHPLEAEDSPISPKTERHP